MTTSGDRGASRTDTAVRIGTVLVAIGAVASIATLVPLFVAIDPLPVAVYLLCFLAPIGLGLILLALWSRARTRSSRLRSADQTHPE